MTCDRSGGWVRDSLVAGGNGRVSEASSYQPGVGAWGGSGQRSCDL